MKSKIASDNSGFSILELIISMTIMLILMAMAGAIFQHSVGTRKMEMQRTEAVNQARNALNLLSREIANSGYGLTDNGLVISDSGKLKIHFRSNIQNQDSVTDDANEDLTYSYDAATRSIVRYDRFSNPRTSTVAKQVGKLTFQYFNYNNFGDPPVASDVPNANTGRVRITISIGLDTVEGQPNNQEITYTSDVSLRNSKYISKQY
jgi:prepilin-type N-terminal cleavage/methylation domain-containing protein